MIKALIMFFELPMYLRSGWNLELMLLLLVEVMVYILPFPRRNSAHAVKYSHKMQLSGIDVLPKIMLS
jgi:hypothetical protein